MREPYITPAGNSFEKKAVFGFVEKNHREPIEGGRLEISQLNPNLALKYSVETFLEENPWAFEFGEEDSIENIRFV